MRFELDLTTWLGTRIVVLKMAVWSHVLLCTRFVLFWYKSFLPICKLFDWYYSKHIIAYMSAKILCRTLKVKSQRTARLPIVTEFQYFVKEIAREIWAKILKFIRISIMFRTKILKLCKFGQNYWNSEDLLLKSVSTCWQPWNCCVNVFCFDSC